MVARIIGAAERAPLPDALLTAGVDLLVAGARRKHGVPDTAHDEAFAADMVNYPIAVQPDEANRQHYEIPAAFFEKILGPRLKYSCCRFPYDETNLADAERIALDQTIENAGLADGQAILELGCGWGSLTLEMAERFPSAFIVAVSNSSSQRAFILARAAERNLNNVTVITADMAKFNADRRFDRIVSVEMFEHMSNWQALLAKTRSWLAEDGRLFIHVFTNRGRSYRFDHADPADWIAQHFFTGGIMPSEGLIDCFPDLYSVEARWHWSGEDYAKTARRWLAMFDQNDAEIRAILAQIYGPEAPVWRRRWRLFFLATAGLFGHAGGSVWGVSHYLLAPVSPMTVNGSE